MLKVGNLYKYKPLFEIANDNDDDVRKIATVRQIGAGEWRYRDEILFNPRADKHLMFLCIDQTGSSGIFLFKGYYIGIYAKDVEPVEGD